MTQPEKISSARCFGGEVAFYKHASSSTQTEMTFSVFLPAQTAEKPCPILYWLSGLTCTAENFTTKAGAHQYAAEHGIVLVMPDTSPRGEGVANDSAYDLGQGAGFYVNATQDPWAAHYKMYDYVVHELPALIKAHFPVDGTKESIFGHSMGGHGALVCALKNPGRYRSVSAFSPIVAPTQCPWGEKALTAYLGEDRETWKAYDAHLLIADAQERLPLLIDQGTADSFLEGQLKPHLLEEACKTHGHPLTLRMQEGYDHSYYFISSFVGEHIAHHSKALHAA